MLTKDGFKRKTYEVIFSELEAKAKELYGENLNTSPRSPMGIFLRLIAWALSIVWQLAEQVYYSAFPSTSEGVSLDRVIKFKAMSRFIDEAARGELLITGTADAVIASGLVVQTRSGMQFETIDDVVLDTSGKGIVEIQALKAGSRGNVGAGEINEVVTLDSNLLAISNPNPTHSGRERETDAELLRRFNDFTESGSSSLPSMEATITSLSGVRDVIIKENTMDETSSDGLPPHSIAPFVFGGTDEDVAEAIFQTKAGGPQSYGSTYVTVYDQKGVGHLIGFTRPTTIQVHVKITLTTNGYFPSDGMDQVQTSIIEYIGGTGADSTDHPGLGLGDDVIQSKIVAAAHAVKGVEDADVTLSVDGIDFSKSNIPISPEEVAKTSYDKVVVT